MSSIANSLAAQAAASTPAAQTSTATPSTLATEDTFLKLLVAQIQNQDPTNPTDSTTFVTQLTQYSQLEQLIGINQGVQKLGQPATNSTQGA